MPHLLLVPAQENQTQVAAELTKAAQLEAETPVTKLLEEAGLSKKVKRDIRSILSDNNLSTEDAVQALSGIAHGGDSDQVRLRAIEMGLKLNGDLADDGKQMPVVNIIIRDSSSIEVNPILIPR